MHRALSILRRACLADSIVDVLLGVRASQLGYSFCSFIDVCLFTTMLGNTVGGTGVRLETATCGRRRCECATDAVTISSFEIHGSVDSLRT